MYITSYLKYYYLVQQLVLGERSLLIYPVCKVALLMHMYFHIHVLSTSFVQITLLGTENMAGKETEQHFFLSLLKVNSLQLDNLDASMLLNQIRKN